MFRNIYYVINLYLNIIYTLLQNHIKLTIHGKNGSLKKSVELFNSGNELISSCYNKSSNLQLVTFCEYFVFYFLIYLKIF